MYVSVYVCVRARVSVRMHNMLTRVSVRVYVFSWVNACVFVWCMSA